MPSWLIWGIRSQKVTGTQHPHAEPGSPHICEILAWLGANNWVIREAALAAAFIREQICWSLDEAVQAAYSGADLVTFMPGQQTMG